MLKKTLFLISLLLLSFLLSSAWASDKSSSTETRLKCDPYTHYACLDDYLGDNFLLRLWRYYQLELGHASAPADPHALSSHRVGWPATPESTPPMPFTE